MPPNRRLIDSKWVFKKKRYSKFSKLLVERGYTQIPGLEFTENYSTVVTGITLPSIIVMWFIKNWDSHTIEVEA